MTQKNQSTQRQQTKTQNNLTTVLISLYLFIIIYLSLYSGGFGVTARKKFIIIKKNRNINRKRSRRTRDMTYFLLKGIDAVSQMLWRVVENAGNSADICLFLDVTWDNPNASSNYGSTGGQSISWMNDTLLLHPMPGWLLYGPWMNNLKLRSQILGFVLPIQEKQEDSDDCVADEMDQL